MPEEAASMMRFLLAAMLSLATIIATGCGPKQPKDIGESIMRAIYAKDYKAAAAPMDDKMQSEAGQHTSELDDLSDSMHKMGSLKSFTQINADPATGHYEYTATFDSGTLDVEMAIDPAGKVSNFHVNKG